MDKINKEILEQCGVADLQNGFYRNEQNGFYRNEQTGSCICIVCGQAFEQGVVYPLDEQLLLAEKAATQHVLMEHSEPFLLLLGQGKAQTGISEIQEQVLRGLHARQSDKQIAFEMGSKSESTIRNHRFQLRKRKKEAKIFLALMELLEKEGAAMESLLKFSTDLPVQDERVNVTTAEAEKIENKHFAAGAELVLRQWPAKEKARLVVLNRIADLFVADRVYTEAEINEILVAVWHDYVMIRRYLIDYEFLVRSRDGGSYRRKVSV